MSGNSDVNKVILETLAKRKPNSLQQLTFFVMNKVPLTEEQVLNAILELESQGEISLRDFSSIAVDFATYLKSSFSFWYWVTFFASIFSVLSFIFIPVTVYPWIYVRNVFGLLFFLWLPGFAFVKLLFPVKLPFKTVAESSEFIERSALSVGLSVVFSTFIGLILYYVPQGFSSLPITFTLFALTLLFATLAIWSEYKARRLLFLRKARKNKAYFKS